MPSEFSVSVDDKQLKAFLQKVKDKIPQALQNVVKDTAIMAKRQVSTDLPKRTGALRRSFRISKVDGLHREVTSILPYASLVEGGGIRPEIKPKRAKFLTIPLRDSVLTSTKAQISQTALNNLFKQLNNRKGRTNRQIFEETGIVLAKKAKAVRIKGGHQLERIVTPKVQAYFEDRINKAVDEVLL